MFVYLVEIKFQGYDTYSGHVVIAESVEEAKKLAASKFGDEGQQIWLDESKIEKIGVALTTERAFVLSKFHAG